MPSTVQDYFAALEYWTTFGSPYTVKQAVIEIAADYRYKLRSGLDGQGIPLASLSSTTLNAPMNRGGKTLRSYYGDVPLSATGATADSIGAEDSGDNEWVIASNSSEGDMILSSNARTSHKGSPFRGDTPKPVRDVLQPGEAQLDIIETYILESLDRVLGAV